MNVSLADDVDEKLTHKKRRMDQQRRVSRLIHLPLFFS